MLLKTILTCQPKYRGKMSSPDFLTHLIPLREGGFLPPVLAGRALTACPPPLKGWVRDRTMPKRAFFALTVFKRRVLTFLCHLIPFLTHLIPLREGGFLPPVLAGRALTACPPPLKREVRGAKKPPLFFFSAMAVFFFFVRAAVCRMGNIFMR